MTGKDFKAFAAQIPDEATIEVPDPGSYRNEWQALQPQAIRAILDLRPKVSMADVCNLEEVSE